MLTRPPLVPYREALQTQQDLVARRQQGQIPDGVWYLEHPPVITWNRSRGLDHLRVDEEWLARRGVELVPTDRGGDITYHGPGQLVGYPIIDLAREGPCQRDLHAYLRCLEEVLIEFLADLGLEGRRVEERTGVWIPVPGGLSKIAAIGVRSRRWVSSHGFALNITCDLTPFRDLIVPCGIADAGVMTLEEALRQAGSSPVPDPAEIAREIHGKLERSLARDLLLSFDGKMN